MKHKNVKALLSFTIALFLFCSCSHLYEPALYHQDIAYQPKPASFDSIKTANYVSAGYDANSNSNLNDFVQSGQIDVSRAHTFSFMNLSYGAFGVLGDYQSDQSNTKAASYFTHKFFGNIGGRFSANAYTSSGNADIRFIGVEAAYSHEFGGYANFRQNLYNKPGYYVDPTTNLLTIGLTSEVIFHNRDDVGFQNGIRVFLGTTLGDNHVSDFYNNASFGQVNIFSMLTFSSLNIFPKASYFMKFKNYFWSVEAGNAVMLRFGYAF